VFCGWCHLRSVARSGIVFAHADIALTAALHLCLARGADALLPFLPKELPATVAAKLKLPDASALRVDGECWSLGVEVTCVLRFWRPPC